MTNRATRRFTGRNVMITGAGAGLGLALAEAFLRQGARVLATDIDGAKLRQLEYHPFFLHGLLRTEVLDVSVLEDFRQCVENLTCEGESLDILVNNAGVCAAGEFVHMPDTYWDDALAINLKGTLNGCRIAAELMKNQASGQIVNIASISGLVPFPATAPYNTSKAAIVALSRSLKVELASSNIHITVVCPGQLDTGMFRNLPTVQLRKETIEENNPFKPVKMDKATGVILAAVARKRFMVVFPFYARLLWWLHRCFPGLIERIFIRKMGVLNSGGTGSNRGKKEG